MLQSSLLDRFLFLRRFEFKTWATCMDILSTCLPSKSLVDFHKIGNYYISFIVPIKRNHPSLAFHFTMNDNKSIYFYLYNQIENCHKKTWFDSVYYGWCLMAHEMVKVKCGKGIYIQSSGRNLGIQFPRMVIS